MKIETKEAFMQYVAEVEAREGYRRPLAFGIGIATEVVVKKDGKEENKILDTYFPLPNYNKNFGTAAILADTVGHLNGTATYEITQEHYDSILKKFEWCMEKLDEHPNVKILEDIEDPLGAHFLYGWKTLVVSFIDQPEHDQGPQGVSDAYLRLSLLSHRLVEPHGVKLEGIFSVLPNVAHTSEGPIMIDDVPKMHIAVRNNGRHLHIYSVDKFPPMADYVIPSGVRIADASRVRFGAHLGDGTTIMHEGFVNFNAGTLGKSMVEGRISAGVTVADGTDIGGGASIMGTLSGGGKEVIKVGKKCLLGANSGIGISFGDECTIEAGLYVTAGSKVLYRGAVVKASTLSGLSGLTFRRNSQNGQIEVLEKVNVVELNEALHSNA